jgi:predicted nuclease of predicted toxin-antitoxin system
VEELQEKGVDIVFAVDVSLRTADDPEILNWALREGRVVVTFDSDFPALHRSGAEHAGILFLTRARDIGSIVETVFLVDEAMSPDEMRGRVEYF